MGRLAGLVLALAAAGVGIAAQHTAYRLEEHRTIGDATPHRLQKLLIVGISDDREVRNRFEDKLASHLRGHEMIAVASHTLVPNLSAIGDRDRILSAIEREGVDGVMTVRPVGLDQIEEKTWAEGWQAWTAKQPTIRELIESTLPSPAKKAKHYGIEFALWEARPARLLWAARSSPCARKDLQEGVADLLQLAIERLEDAHWL